MRTILVASLVALVCLNASARAPRKKRPSEVVVSTLTATAFDPRLEYTFRRQVDPGALQAQLVAAGFAVNYVDCKDGRCTIHLKAGETKDPMPIVKKYVYVDAEVARQKKIDAIKALYAKLKDGTISPQDKDSLLMQLTALVLGL